MSPFIRSLALFAHWFFPTWFSHGFLGEVLMAIGAHGLALLPSHLDKEWGRLLAHIWAKSVDCLLAQIRRALLALHSRGGGQSTMDKAAAFWELDFTGNCGVLLTRGHDWET